LEPKVLKEAQSADVLARFEPFIKRKVSYSALKCSGVLERRNGLQPLARLLESYGCDVEWEDVSPENGNFELQLWQIDLRKYGPALVELGILQP
jgi:hypothetical protein